MCQVSKTNTDIKMPSSNNENKNLGTGAWPRVYPRPEYPAFWKVVLWEVHHWLEMGIVGVVLVHFLTPLYEWTRQWVHGQEGVDDRLYMILAIFAVHSGTYVVANLRKSYRWFD